MRGSVPAPMPPARPRSMLDLRRRVPIASLGGVTMTDKISVIAQIRPGKREELERLLEKGPPFDLAAEGFERHEVFVGDSDVVFLFTGPGALTQLERMA